MWNDCPYAIFDMDGTLIDSMPYWKTLASDYLRDRGKTPEPDVNQTISAMTMEEAARYFKDHYGVEGTPESIKEGVSLKMRENYLTRIPAKAGVTEYLEQLKKAGVTLCLCSSTSEELIRLVLDRLNLTRFFSHIVSCEEAGAGKDRPDAYLLCLQKMGAEPSACAVYEDAFFAMETAAAIGCPVVGVYDSSCKRTEDQVRAFCDGYIKDFRDRISSGSRSE